MSLRVSDFAAVQRAALCAARVAVSAAVSSSERDIWGVSDPLCHPPIAVPGLDPWGSLTPQMHVAVVRQNRASSVTSPSAPPVSCVTPTWISSAGTRLTGFAGNSVHIGERALALNQRLRRSPTVTSSLSSNPRVSFVSWVLALSDLVATRCGHHDRRIVRRSSARSSHSASLRP